MTVRGNSPAAVRARRAAGNNRKRKASVSRLRVFFRWPLRHWKTSLFLALFLLGGLLTNLDRGARYLSRLNGLRRFMPAPVAELLLPPQELDYGVAAEGAELFGTVTRVVDGDTFVFRSVGDGEALFKVRMWGIDAPEKSQTWGEESGKTLEAKILNRAVRLKVMAADRYSRQVCRVFGDREEDINLYMVSTGNAWHYPDDAESDELAAAMTEARRNRRGLWTYQNPEPPRQYRQHNK
ncbi:MAG: thermonuclease family protein [Victivallaceae bacterium]|nr:thermonuclease family protein [Victivallaceae bacterium]